MEVILLERIDKLGQMGDVVNVKPGYARNFLLPQKKALRATETNKKHFEAERTQLEAQNLEHRTEAEKLGKKMDAISVIMIRQAGEAGQLFGSVNARDIAAAVTEAGFTITRQQVKLDRPIKALGLYDIRVFLHPEVDVTVVANIARSKDEAKIQIKTGKAIISADEEEELAAADAAADAAAEAAAEAADQKTAGEEKAKAPEHAKAEEETKDAEEAADEAMAEQAEEIFEEGAAPQPEPEPEAKAGEGSEDKAESDAGDKAGAGDGDKSK